jgi:sugar phosphate isomerase/epimerase
MQQAKFKRGVSIYSYQEKYYTGALSLEGCVAAAAATGARGIELVAEQMLPGYPSIRYNLKPEFREHWHSLMAKFGTQPIAMDCYGETKLYRHRSRSDAELVDEIVEYFKTAKALGFGIVRLSFHLPQTVIEALVPKAEQLDVKFGIEVHAPHHLDGDWVQRNIEIMQKTGTRHFGLIPDLGTFCRTIPKLVIEQSLRHGAQPRLIEYLQGIYASRETPADLIERVKTMGGNQHDEWLAMRVQIAVWTWHDPALLARYAPHIIHIHAKFYEMSADHREPDVAYDAIMPALIGAGYTGYLMSEYEGQRLTDGLDMGYDEVEQVRRHQTMLGRWLTH